MKLFDSHCHLQDERFAGQLPTLLTRAQAVGIQGFLCCATAESDWNAVLDLARQYPAIKPALGVHPWYLDNRSPHWIDQLHTHLRSAPYAVGEIGLDHAIKPRNDTVQEEVFIAQIKLAADLQRPVSLHCRQAWGRLVELLKTVPSLPPALIIHSYSGSPDLVPVLLKQNVYFSFSGSLTRPDNTRAHRAAVCIPDDHLLVETDAPDIPPHPSAMERCPLPLGSFNEPATLPCVVAKLAELRQTTPDTIAELTWQNAVRLLGPCATQE